MGLFYTAPPTTHGAGWMDGWMDKVQRHFKQASSGYIMPEEV